MIAILQQLVYNLNRTVTQRLDIIESKLEAMQGKTRELEDKVEAILNHMVATQNVAITKQEQDATPNEYASLDSPDLFNDAIIIK